MPPPPPPPCFDFPDETVQRPLPNIESSLNDNINSFPPHPPPPPPLPPFQKFFQPRPFQRVPDVTVGGKNNAATNTTQTMSGNRLIDELERVIERKETKENLVPEDDIVFASSKIPEILDNEDFEQKQEIKKQQDDEINNEIDLNRLKDEIDAGKISRGIEFYFGGQNHNFFFMCSKLNLSNDNENIINFLSSDVGLQILRKICYLFTLRWEIFSMKITTGMNQSMIFC